jgi:hypothetical protein
VPTTPTAQRARLGTELRVWRVRSGVSRDVVAEALACSLGKISKFENGNASLSPLEIRTLIGLYGIPSDEAEKIIAIADEARQRTRFRTAAPWLRAFVNLEAVATHIKDFQIDLIPSALQTESYIRVITQAADPSRNAAEVERLVAIRRERQTRLLGEDAPALTVVMHEAAIRAHVGGREVMVEQLHRILELARLPKVTVQVLPFAAGAHGSMGSTFIILSLPEPHDSQVVYLEDLYSGEYLQRGEQVTAYNRVFDRLRDAALDDEGTQAIINRVLDEWQ